MHVAKEGFKVIDLTDLILSVQDSISRNFALQLGSVSESISVEGGVSLINTESAAVSTVVDRAYVDNMPLNGRSFQDLILLTPGVVTNSPQNTSAVGLSGEFSVNGQRTESNYYTVDGVSANLGIYTFFNQRTRQQRFRSGFYGTRHYAGAGLGGCAQEFRVQSSTYSAEYGRNPGGQFSFVTRSGTNQWHGTAFDYLRNNVFDANDWFNNYNRVAEAEERQNDFGGTLGGPLTIPRLYNGKDKTFFFFSYEGLRLRQPRRQTLSPCQMQRCDRTRQLLYRQFSTLSPLPTGRTWAMEWPNSSVPGPIQAVSIRPVCG